MLLESLLHSLVKAPAEVLSAAKRLASGKAAFKAELVRSFEFDPALLPYNTTLLERLQQETGREIILCTASDQVIAQKIADHLNIFSKVMSSDGVTNLSRDAKAAALVEKYGKGGFDYVGNSADDLAVWAVADRAWVVNARERVLASARAQGNVELVLPRQNATIKTWLKALRVHQWVKNVLVFLPLLAAHSFADLGTLAMAIVGFFAFSLTASGVYVVNDLIDLPADRSHPTKRFRAFAAGKISIPRGIIAAILLFLGGIFFGSIVSPSFLVWLLIYAATTTAYSFRLKQVVLLDCFVLAALYTLRIMAGGELLAQSLSIWLICISMFTFISLAFVKRYVELDQQKGHGSTQIKGRGYLVSDAPLVMAFGIASGYAAAVIMGLYVNNPSVRDLYQSPEIIALTIPVLCFWNSWVWLKASRGEMDQDPVMFVVKDSLSLACAGIFAVILGTAALL
jgi:4-hydroxybenzoate polyprenyltransferase